MTGHVGEDVPLFPYATPRARSSDPDTSHAAAASVADVRETQRAVWWVLSTLGPMTDEQLVNAYEAVGTDVLNQWGLGGKRQSPQGLRSRRAELVRAGLVRDTGERRPMTTGRMARVWAAVRT